MKTVKNKWIRILSAVAVLLLVCLLPGCRKDFFIKETHDTDKAWEGPEGEKAPRLAVHFMDVGQGDCTLLISNGHAMLIDAGDDSQGTKVQKYLKEQGIEKLDYVMGTHPDADHIGGLDVILTKFDCETILFTDAVSDTVAYRNVMETVRYREYEITEPELGASFPLGSATFTVVGPAGVYEEGSNNYSIGLRVTFGENSFLFIGDAEEKAQMDMLQSGADLSCDVLKAGHHGSSDSANLRFLEAVGAEYAVISCGIGNDYGHPHAKTLRLFQELDMQVFRTDEQGTVTAVSDGSRITWSCAPSETWQAGVYTGGNSSESNKEYGTESAGAPSENTGEVTKSGKGAVVQPNEEAIPENAKYILNTNSYKFHRPECESVADMSRRNKKGSDLSREEIIALGYSPCSRCKP